MSASIRAPERRRVGRRAGSTLVGAALLLAGLAAPASAALVVMRDGSWMKVPRVEVKGDRAEIHLDSGGRLRLSLLRIDRIVDDEIVPPDPEAIAQLEEARATIDLRYRDGMPVPSVPYGEAIHAAARRHGLNPAVVAAVVRFESAFRADAVSVKGAQGLMQLMPATAARFGVARADAVFEPTVNLDVGCRYLRWLADRFDDDAPRVLAAYNAGEGAVDRYDGVPPYRETRTYLTRIFDHLGLAWGDDA
ncbi:MAG: lytic transglycosylase domain-containing protein [Acidobacteriota bacterium]